MQALKRFLYAVGFISLLLLVSNVALADASKTTPENKMFSSWENDKDQAIKLIHGGDCERGFQILWPYVKQGNVEAKEGLLYFMHFEPFLNLPGRSGDYVSRVRDILILTIHEPQIKDQQLGRTYLSYLKGLDSDKTFAKCVGEKREECIQDLIRRKIIPPIQNYFTEIDVLSKAGLPATCSSR